MTRKTENKSVTRSFRINEAAFDAIQEEAQEHNISVNTLVNQLLMTYANLDRFLNKIHMIKMPAPSLKDIFEAAPDEKLIELGRLHGSTIPKTLTFARRGEFSLDTLLEDLRTVLEYSPTAYTEVVHGAKRTFQMIHELGPKYSLYIASFLKAAFEAVGAWPKISSDVNTVVVELGPSS